MGNQINTSRDNSVLMPPCFPSLFVPSSFHSAGAKPPLLHSAGSEPGRPPQLLRPADKSAAVRTIMMVKPGTYASTNTAA